MTFIGASSASAPGPGLLLSAGFRAESRSSYSRLYNALDITLPDASTVRLASVGLASTLRGQYLPLVTSWGSVSRNADPRSYRLSASDLEIEIAEDEDRAWSAIYSQYRHTLRGCAAVVRILSPRVADADSFMAYRGIIASCSCPRPFVWRIRATAQDTALRNTDLPRLTIAKAEWPKADAAALGNAYPYVYGVHSSGSLSGEGMLPTYYVDTVGFVYLVAAGWLKSVSKVYKDGVTVASGYTITHPIVNGRLCTCVDFTTTQGSSAITVDVEGLTDKYDGSGSLISNPCAAIAHFLSTFVFADWRSGPYPAQSSLIDATSFGRVGAQLVALGYEASRWLGGTSKVQADAELEAWGTSFGARPYWTNDGRIGVALLSPYPEADRFPYLWLRQGDDLGGWSYDSNVSNLTREVSVKYLHDQVQNKYEREALCQYPRLTERASVSHDLVWSRAAL